MAKWFGVVGYGKNVEKAPGVWDFEVIERKYSGDLIRNISRWSPSSTSTNDNLDISNQISIVADPFAYENFNSMLYVEFMRVKWKINSIEVQHPRLILTIGGEYNE